MSGAANHQYSFQDQLRTVRSIPKAQALVGERMLSLEKNFVEEDGCARIGKTTAHKGFLRVAGATVFSSLRNQQGIGKSINPRPEKELPKSERRPLSLDYSANTGNSVDISFDSQIFIDEKPEYYTFANQTTFMTGAEVFAKYGPGQE